MFNHGAFHFFVMMIVTFIVMSVVAVFIMSCAVFPHVLITASIILAIILGVVISVIKKLLE